MELLLAPQTKPFAVAGLILIGLVLIEIAMVVIGASASSLIEKAIGHETGADHDAGAVGSMWYWLNPGRVPILIVIMIALAAFSAAGFIAHAAAGGLNVTLPAWLGIGFAVIAAIAVMRSGTRLVAHIVPRDETYVVDDDSFVGSLALVTLGPLDQGRPGRVQARDRFGNLHFLMARAAEGQPDLPVGAQVLLVDRHDKVFLAIPAPDDLTS